jgi:flagellar biosynthesis/type III secretory pathway M-ring protein FliF/YscJ
MLAVSTALVIVVAIAAVAIVVGVLFWRRRHRPDTVAAFQRHIGALSPEARRPVVDKVQQLEQDERPDPNGGGVADGS